MTTARICAPLALLLCAGCATTSTSSSTPEAAAGAAAVREQMPERAPAAAADAITEQSVRSHMSFLASDALNGRGSGTRDEWIAAEYLASQLQQAGIDPPAAGEPYVQQIEIEYAEATGPAVMTAGDTRFTHGREIFVQTLGSQSISGPLQKFSPTAQPGPGAVVLMPESPPEGYRRQVAGAAAVLLLETPQARSRWGSSRLSSPPPRILGVPPGSVRLTTVYLDKATYGSVAAIAAGAAVSIDVPVKPAARTQTWNAMGRLQGGDPAFSAEVILLSAHLDHVGNRPPRSGAIGADTIYNGADDDASGSVAVLELARALAKGPRPKRTIVFAFFGSEEAGGYGSQYFADRPVVPLARIVANLQFEMIGRPDSKVPARTLWLTGYERSTLGPALAKQGARLVQDPHPEENFFARSDNVKFARRGVVAHTVSSFGLHQEYHQPSDEIRHIDLAHMTNAIRSMLGPVRWLANSGFKPEWLPGGRP